MRILFFISASGHGKGGHSHSLNLISRKIADHAEVRIIALGPGKSKVLETNPHFHELIYSNGFPGPGVIKAVKKNVLDYNPDVIHCFDAKIYTVITLSLTIAGLKRYPVVLNKCGGPNLATYPVSKHLILFSKENEVYFSRLPRFKNTSIHLIPNRVMIDKDQRTSDIFTKKNGEFVIFKISRIGEYYRKTLTQCIELARQLWDRGERNFRLYLVGTIDEQKVYEDLQKMIGELPVTIVTDNSITIKAAAYLHYADAAICTGRGFMEACALGIPVLAGSVNHAHPIVVDNNNFNDFFFYNFSERAKVPVVPGEDQVQKLVNLIRDEQTRARFREMATNWFREHFDIEKGAARYMAVYETARKEPSAYYLKSNWRQLLSTLRSFHLSNKKIESAVQ